MIQGIGLIRVSTQEQSSEKHAGIPAQRHAIEGMARQRSIELIETIEITDVSGSRVLSAPAFQRFLRLLEKPSVQAVVTKEFSRVMRPENFNDYVILQTFVDNGITLHLPDGPIDFSNKFGKFMATVRAGIAGMEREEILRRMNDAKEEMRRAGKHPSGSHTLPTGIAYLKDRGWYYTAEIELVKQIFRLFQAGEHNLAEVSRHTGLPRSTVGRILRNEAYTGWMIYDEKRDLSLSGYVSRSHGRQGYRKKVKRQSEEIIRVKLPLTPLLTKEAFHEIQSILDKRRRLINKARSRNRPQFTYNGFLFCSDCKAPLYTHFNRRQYFYYCSAKRAGNKKAQESNSARQGEKRAEATSLCTNKYMLRDKLEPRIDEVIEGRLTDSTFLSPIIARYLQKPTTCHLDPNCESIRQQLQSLKQKRSRILESFFDGTIAKDERDEALACIRRQSDSLERITPLEKRKQTNWDDITEAVSVFSEWSFLSRNQKRRLLNRLVPEIFAHQYHINGLTLRIGGGESAHPWKRAKSRSAERHGH